MKVIKGAKLQTILDDIRIQISDVGEMYDDEFLVSAINSSLKQLARKKGLRRLFKVQYQAQLATINADGKPAARWDLSDIHLVGKERLNFISEDDCYTDLQLCYKTPKEFHRCYRMPELQQPGTPCFYTIEHIGDTSTIIFDRPPVHPVSMDAVFYVVPPRIKPGDEFVAIPEMYSDLLVEMVKIYINAEQTDMATANARWENLDQEIYETAQQLALQHMMDMPLIVRGIGG